MEYQGKWFLYKNHPLFLFLFYCKLSFFKNYTGNRSVLEDVEILEENPEVMI